MAKKFLTKSVILLMTTAMCMVGNIAAYADTQADENPAVYVTGTTINGINVTGKTPEEAKGYMESYYAGSFELTIIDSSGRETKISNSDIQLSATVNGGLSEVLDQENQNGRASGPSVDNSYTVDMTVSYDKNALSQKLESMPCMTTGVIQTADAHISAWAEGQPFTIVPEVAGNSINKEAMTAAVKNAVETGQRTLNLYDADCYEKVQIRSDNQELAQLCENMNKCVNMSITYAFGDQSEVLQGNVIASWIQGSQGTEININRDEAAAFVKGLADKYNTAGREHVFKTTSGKEVTVTGPYGWKLDEAGEIEALIGMIRTGESQTREPSYAQQAASRSGNDYGNTYVEIDLGQQHMYLYENGAMILDAPFVSGNVSKGWTTPPGIFGLYYKQRDKILRGEDYASPVDYWMPFNGGIGLHDANWRSTFGGTIYQKSGSHGCINLPPAKAAVLYDHVYKNIPVICYN